MRSRDGSCSKDSYFRGLLQLEQATSLMYVDLSHLGQEKILFLSRKAKFAIIASCFASPATFSFFIWKITQTTIAINIRK